MSAYRIAGALVASLVLWAGGCSLVEDPEWIQVEIRTDRETYDLRPDTDPMPRIVGPIRVAISNASSRPIYYLAPSEWVTLEKWVDGDWVSLGGSRDYYLPVPPRVFEIEPGGHLEDAVVLPLRSEVLAGAGVYRFVFELFADAQARDLLALEHRVSNRFEIIE